LSHGQDLAGDRLVFEWFWSVYTNIFCKEYRIYILHGYIWQMWAQDDFKTGICSCMAIKRSEDWRLGARNSLTLRFVDQKTCRRHEQQKTEIQEDLKTGKPDGGKIWKHKAWMREVLKTTEYEKRKKWHLNTRSHEDMKKEILDRKIGKQEDRMT
jgi:hypothetical protein